MSERRRVVHIAPSDPFGGVQKVVLELATAQRARGRDVEVIWTGASGLAATLSIKRGIPTVTAQSGLASRLFAVRSALNRSRAEIVHLHMAPPWVLPVLPLRSALCCVHLHGQRPKHASLKSKIAAALERQLISRADVLIAISSWISQQWQTTYPGAKITLVHNGVPTEEPDHKMHDHVASAQPVIGFASRLAPDKGVREFIDIALEMHAAIPHARFIVAGDGSEMTEIKSKLAPLITAGSVQLLGHVEDMPEFWAQLDLAVFCAPSEPFGLRIIEPLVHNVPVVAYRTGAGSDEVADLCAGIVTVPYGEVRAMAAQAADLLLDVDRRRSIAAAGKRDVERRFSIGTMVSRIDDVYAAGWERRFGSR